MDEPLSTPRLRLLRRELQPSRAMESPQVSLRERLRRVLGSALSRAGVAGAIQNFETTDRVTGDYVRVVVGSTFTVVSVNGRDLYFDRMTGRFDGSGMGCGS